MISDVLCIQHKMFILFSKFLHFQNIFVYILFVYIYWGWHQNVFASSNNLHSFACLWRDISVTVHLSLGSSRPLPPALLLGASCEQRTCHTFYRASSVWEHVYCLQHRVGIILNVGFTSERSMIATHLSHILQYSIY